MPRPPVPEDLTRLRIPTEPRLSPDGRLVACSVKTAAPGHDGYRSAVWLVPTDGSRPARQATLGHKNDHHPRFMPDGSALAFLSDRRHALEEEPGKPEAKDREDGTQVYLLPLDGGEARRVSDLPRGVESFEISPDGRRLVVASSSRGATTEEDARRRGKELKREPGQPPESDYRYTDRLNYLFNGVGFIAGTDAHLWLVDLETAETRRLTDGPTPDEGAAWSPDGTRVAFSTNRRRDHDLRYRTDVFVVEVGSGRETKITGREEPVFSTPTWLPDGRTVAVLGGTIPENAYRSDIWLFAADGSEATPDGGRNISGEHDLMPGAAMNSDVTIGEGTRLVSTDDGAITFLAPIDGSMELWRIDLDGGAVTRLTEGRHYLSSFDRVGDRIATVRSAPTEPPEIHLVEVAGRGTAQAKPLTELNTDVVRDLDLREAIERRWTVDDREIQGWLIPSGEGRRPVVTEIHGGPHTLYGWSPVWEFQLLAANGMSVFYCNPRGSEGYGREFNEANLRDWGPGPMRDVIAGIDALVEDGLADPERLGVTGGSYGGYLTNWIVAHDDRFRAALTARSVTDMAQLFLTGDISGGEWAEQEFKATPWTDPDFFREISPITYASRIRTPLLIQHSERDLRTTVAQAEGLFTVLRSLKRPVRLMRVPDETHELTRSGTPFRRVENLVQVRDWFRHYLVQRKRGLPPLPKARAGR